MLLKLPQENRCPAMEVCLSDYDEDLPGQGIL